jgi:hypothetical protein
MYFYLFTVYLQLRLCFTSCHVCYCVLRLCFTLCFTVCLQLRVCFTSCHALLCFTFVSYLSTLCLTVCVCVLPYAMCVIVFYFCVILAHFVCDRVRLCLTPCHVRYCVLLLCHVLPILMTQLTPGRKYRRVAARVRKAGFGLGDRSRTFRMSKWVSGAP